MTFSAFECAGYQVGWPEVDSPIDSEDYLIEREFRKLKRHCPDPVDLPFLCMLGFTDFYNPACPAHLVSSSVPLRSCRLSPSESRACLSSCIAYDRARGPHMVSDKCINRWSASPTHGSPPLFIPVLVTIALPLFLLAILSQPHPI